MSWPSRHLAAASAARRVRCRRAAVAQEVTGHWLGEIAVPGQPLGIDVDSRAPAGRLVARVTSRSRSRESRTLDLVDVSLAGDAIGFRMPGIPGDPTFAGVVEGDVIAGSFTQGGAELGFRLSRGAIGRRQRRGWRSTASPSFVAEAIADWNVPGLALAVVRGGEVVLAEGFGWRDVEDEAADDRRHPCPSARRPRPSPPRCSACWSTRASSTGTRRCARLPARASGSRPDHHAADHAARPGDPPLGSAAPRPALVQRATRAPAPSWSRPRPPRGHAGLREKFQYNNLMFLTAGHLVERLTGDRPGRRPSRERLLDPLGMRPHHPLRSTICSGTPTTRGPTARTTTASWSNASRSAAST